MRLTQVVFALLIACCGNLTTKSNPSVTVSVNNPRSLRIHKPIDDEERMFQVISKWATTTWWLETGKTDDYIKKTLGLEGLWGSALKSAPNYMYYEHFLETREGYILKNLLKREYPTKDIWAMYNLENVPSTQLKEKEGFKTYLRYAIMEDDKIFKLKSQDKDVVIDTSNTTPEMVAKVDMWVSLGRPKWYVKTMLNLDRRSYKATRTSKNYWLYERFENAIKGRTQNA
ncbi:RxLR effector protein [Phytophthora megakarya]|uniref:RxLR effector protein n=1 Tax=Phytophthora megakarya TaxID=4795 RepID=A0A225VT47_9STRA|nr:RxLR effector protein [Phytophthora megakarya]